MTDLLCGKFVDSAGGFLVGQGAGSEYWGELPQAEFSRLMAAVEEGEDFDAAVFHYFAGHSRKDLYPYITDCWGRGSWHSFVSPSAGAVAVDLGAGMGAITEYLAGHYSHVFSIEGCQDRCRFLVLRKTRKKLTNVTVINAGVYQLPFSDGSIDLVACNGVLEWVAIGSTGKVSEVQLQVLREIRRVLKPDGILYVGIENRWALAYLLGLTDHSGLRFTSLVPRWLAGLMVRLLKKGDRFSVAALADAYRTYTYGCGGYHSLLRKAGFSNNTAYCVEPSYDIPSYAYPADFTRKQMAGFYRLFGSRLVPWRLHRYLCSNFFLFAAKENGMARVNRVPMFFGYHERVTLERDSVVRQDQMGATTEEPVVTGKNCLHIAYPNRRKITAKSIIEAYEQFAPDRRYCSRQDNFSALSCKLDLLLGGILSAATLAQAKAAIASRHMESCYHGDFWLGNLLLKKNSSELVLIDPEPQLFGSPALDYADFMIEYHLNKRKSAGFRVDLSLLAGYFGVDIQDQDLLVLSLIRQVLRYSPWQRSNVLAFRYLALLQQWEQTGAVPFGHL